MTDWADTTEEIEMRQLVRDNPRRSDEGVMSYARRLAILGGYLRETDNGRREPGAEG